MYIMQQNIQTKENIKYLQILIYLYFSVNSNKKEILYEKIRNISIYFRN